jgi:formylglycine-generating enzyme required for sulfatase activity
MKKIYFYILAALLIAACNPVDAPDNEVEPASISINKLNFESDLSAQQFSITNESGGTVSYSVTSNKDWIMLQSGSSSSDAAKSAVGTVDVGGSVVIVVVIDQSGLSKGTYTGTITIDVDGTKYTITVTITVDDVTVSGISLDCTTLALKSGETATLQATVTPANAVNKTVTWTSSNTAVATVDSTGKVTAIKEGSAVITAKAGEKTATCTVSVAAATLTVTPATYNFTASGGDSTDFTVTSNQSWTISSNATWLTTSATSGSNNGTFTATATANTTTTQRTAAITVSCTGITRTINVTQDAATLSVEPTTYNFAAAGETSSAFTVTSNQSWTITDDADWLSTSITSGSGNTSFTATATANTSTTQRTAIITVAGGGGSRTINITQNGNQATQTIEMVLVRGGTFVMGCTSEQGSDCYENESPAHPVTLSDFYIGKYEVTRKEWYDIMGVNPSSGLCSNCPVNLVSWNDIVGTSGASEVINGITYYANGFIYKLNQKTGKKYRLPTEAEWEFAARGGISSKGYKYSGSDTVDNVAWSINNNVGKTQAVGTKQANELGIYDMSGSVCEWCADWYGSYSSAVQTNPTGPTSGVLRVNRGGDWNNLARFTRVSSRSYHFPATLNGLIGFRVACSP